MNTGHRSFVLVHGAWHGAYVWQSILPQLRALGHIATAPTLSGLGERSYFASDTIDLKWHIEDVVSHIVMEDLRNITLVGWSYAGMVITGVLAQLPDRISKVVYLDAFVPSDGQALIDYATPDALAVYDLHKKYNQALPPPELSVSGWPDPKRVAFLEPRLLPQPWRTFYQPVEALKIRPDIPFSYIVCTGWGPTPFTARIAEMEADPAMQVIKINSNHHCMITAPEETLRALID
jgi:pimeloyl-ACP methyl ester carboxylesterase